ncbi:MAG: hypothetical protein GY810_05145 [Aureispira sp.]|nr:hypothetical protein [Aureispira sp.]
MEYENIKVKSLGDIKGDYKFGIRKTGSSIYVEIPGHGGGRDGPQIPSYPEQEEWMRKHSGLEEVWYLTWEVKNQEDLDKFIQKLKGV